jgi:deoxyribonuclease V
MRVKHKPEWKGLVESWKATQQTLREKLVIAPFHGLPRLIAGGDAAYSERDEQVFAVALIWDRVEQRIIEISRAVRKIEFPYIPTFLSFREGPALTEAIGNLKHPFEIICFDGQGIAHPRRCGLAAHMGAMLGLTSIGVAKSRLIGTFSEPGQNRGSHAALMDGDEQIGLVLRTRDNTKPLFISIGNRIDLPSARRIVLESCTRYRVPEPTRLADIEVAKVKKRPLA